MSHSTEVDLRIIVQLYMVLKLESDWATSWWWSLIC